MRGFTAFSAATESGKVIQILREYYDAVGVIGAASRLEYAAVGPTVNLASRLYSEAAHAEVLVDERTCELVGAQRSGADLVLSAPLELKGYARPVRYFVLTST